MKTPLVNSCNSLTWQSVVYEQTSRGDDSGGGGGRVSGSEHFDLTRGRSGGRGKRSGSWSAFDSCNMSDRCQRLQHTARWFEIGNSGCRLRAHWFYHTSWPGYHNRLQRGRCSSHGNVSQLLTRRHRGFYSLHTFVLLNNEKLIQWTRSKRKIPFEWEFWLRAAPALQRWPKWA